jgi:hypothetical protein
MTEHGGLLSAARMIDVTVDIRRPPGWLQCDARDSATTAMVVRRDRGRDGGCSVTARTRVIEDVGPALGARAALGGQS